MSGYPAQSVKSLSCDKSDEIKPQAEKRFTDIYLKAVENPGKSQLQDRLMKAAQKLIASNGVPYLQRTSVVSHNISGREKEGMKEIISRIG